MKSKLSLKKETLSELTSDALRMVQGGAESGSCTSCVCSCYQLSCGDILTMVVDKVTGTVNPPSGTARTGVYIQAC